MKCTSLLLTLFSLVITIASAQTATPAWPVNPKTGAVVFSGRAAWPAKAKTEAQRRAYVQQWYFSKLTESSSAEVAADVSSAKRLHSKVQITYPDVMRAAIMSGDSSFLSYTVDVSPANTGFSYRLTDFDFTSPSGNRYTIPVALKEKRHQQALAAFRKRLAEAEAALR